MYLISSAKLLQLAQQGGYAVPAFNIHNLETIQVITETAAAMGSPVIMAGTPSTFRYADVGYFVAICEEAARFHGIPLALHLDHHEDFADISEKVLAGVRSVMIDGSHHCFEGNVAVTQQVVAFCHRYGASVEAELGRLVGMEDDLVVDEKESAFTDPDAAVEFAARTGIDSLTVAIGSAHGLYKGTPKLDMARLRAIRDKVSIPLVLHGASGLPAQMVKEAIASGVCKVNVATELKIAFSDAVKEYFSTHAEANDPRHYLEPGKQAMRAVVEDKITMCGSAGKLM